jgi:hypothetical protein
MSVFKESTIAHFGPPRPSGLVGLHVHALIWVASDPSKANIT